MTARSFGMVLVGVLAASPALGGPAAGAQAATLVDTDCAAIQVEDRSTDATSPSLPFELLDMQEAWRPFEQLGRVPGAGVRVAVVDSGVSADAEVTVVERVSFSTGREPGEYHGTAVAGLIAGALRDTEPELLPVGFAPGAEIVDVRVYDRTQPDDGEVGVETPRVAAGLRWVAANARRLGIGVVNVSLAVSPDDELRAAIRAVAAQDVVIVAGSGNRPLDGEPLYEDFGEPRTGQDARAAISTAGYGAVPAVNATADGVDVRGWVLQNSATDVAVPTYNAITTSVNGGTCVLPSATTSWAAAEVSGIVVLLRAAFPDDNARQIITRLEATADGTTAAPTVLTGAGTVQAVEALTRPLRPGRDGQLRLNDEEQDRNQGGTAAAPPLDHLAQPRQNAIWLALLGGRRLPSRPCYGRCLHGAANGPTERGATPSRTGRGQPRSACGGSPRASGCRSSVDLRRPALGIAVGLDSDLDAAPVLRRADAAIYLAKEPGRNRVTAAGSARPHPARSQELRPRSVEFGKDAFPHVGGGGG